MTDTIVKPLVWEKRHGYSTAKTMTPWPKKVMHSPDAATEKAEQDKHEAEHVFNVLSAIDLSSYRAQIRAEALEEAAGLLRTIADKSLRSGKVPEAIVNNYRRSANILQKRSASTLIEKGKT